MKNKPFLFLIAFFFSSLGNAWTHQGSNTFGWRNEKLTLYVNPTNCTISQEELFDLVDRAISAWNGIPSTKLELVRASAPALDGDPEFRAGTATQLPLVVCSNNLNDYGSVDADSILGFVPYFQEDSDGYVVYSGLVLNAQPGALAELSQLEPGERELVVGHELGHVLGLGHSGDPSALMYFQLNKNFLLLTQDDQDGVAQLYPKNVFDGIVGCSASHQVTSELPRTAIAISLIGLALLLITGRWIFKIEPLREFEE